MIKRLLLTLALATPAGAFELQWPVACVLGETCHIQHYVDRDPSPGTADFTCGTLTYDGHDGTDIALPNRAAMAAGVSVTAAAPGTVLGTRDGIADFVPPISGKECGNGVIVDDGAGWQTQYCHLKQGSVAVRKGDRIAVGTLLGEVGQSGAAEFPHLHLTVRHNGQPVDPFAPDEPRCGRQFGPGLWASQPPYEAGGFQAAGFAADLPSFDAIKAGLPTVPLAPDAPALVLWAEIFGGRAGDEVAFSVTDPNGEVILTQTTSLDRTQDLLFRAFGTRAKGRWPSGVYRGTVILTRGGQEIDRTTTQVTVP